jgi:hypothetical protein
MRRTVAPILLSLACAAALAGCRRGATEGGVGAHAGGSGDPGADAVIRQLRDFTEELAGKVERAADPKAGAGEAQRLLDARGPELSARIAAFKRGARDDAAARGRWLEAEVDSTQRVRQLQLKYLDASMRDPELKAALERLAADYDSLFKER